jgi:hypothetical protein
MPSSQICLPNGRGGRSCLCKDKEEDGEEEEEEEECRDLML